MKKSEIRSDKKDASFFSSPRGNDDDDADKLARIFSLAPGQSHAMALSLIPYFSPLNIKRPS